MKAVKRVEIICETAGLEEIRRLLERAGVSGFTVFNNVTGQGGRGRREDDELTGVFRNCCVMTACAPEQAARIAERLRPVLRRYSGVCLVSDAMWLHHGERE